MGIPGTVSPSGCHIASLVAMARAEDNQRAIWYRVASAPVRGPIDDRGLASHSSGRERVKFVARVQAAAAGGGGTAPSLRSRQALHGHQLPAAAGLARHHDQHESARGLLGQCRGGKLFRDAEDRTGRRCAVAEPLGRHPSAPPRSRVVQPRPTPFELELPGPRGIRTAAHSCLEPCPRKRGKIRRCSRLFDSSLTASSGPMSINGVCRVQG